MAHLADDTPAHQQPLAQHPVLLALGLDVATVVAGENDVDRPRALTGVSPDLHRDVHQSQPVVGKPELWMRPACGHIVDSVRVPRSRLDLHALAPDAGAEPGDLNPLDRLATDVEVVRPGQELTAILLDRDSLAVMALSSRQSAASRANRSRARSALDRTSITPFDGS